MTVTQMDMRQKPGKEFKPIVENGSCDREGLLKVMLGGSILADGCDGGTQPKAIKHNPKAEVVVIGETNDFIIQISHKGLLELIFEDVNKNKYIILQDNGNLPQKKVEAMLQKRE